MKILEGEREIPPEAIAQAFEDFLLATFYAQPDSLDAKVKARNLRNHMYKFLTEPIRVRGEVDPAHEFAQFGKRELIELHGQLSNLETIVMKRERATQENTKDLRAAICEVQEGLETIVNELPNEPE